MNGAARIQSFCIEGFKSFQKADLRLFPLTLLIGPNASGKSNLIEALRLLAWMARGQRFDQVLRAVEDGSLVLRGRMQDLPQNGHDTFRLGCRFFPPLAGNWDHFEVGIQASGADPRIVAESVDGASQLFPLYRVEVPAVQFSHDIQVAYNNFARGGKKPRITCTDQQLVLTQLGTPARFGSTHEKAQHVIPLVTKRIAEAMGSILLLDPSPRRMRGYTHRLDSVLKEDGSNVSGVLFDICETQGRKEKVLGFIRSLPEQDIRDITFVKTPRDEVMVSLEESFAGRQQTRDAPVLSDGTLRVLAAAAAVLSAPEGALVVIEEIDNGVHPSRARSLLNNLQSVSTERNLSVLVTSHNPALLDALPLDAIPHVACCFRDPDDGTSRLVHLQDLPRYPELVAQGTVGRLMTTGILDRYLKDKRAEEDRKAEDLQWLEKLADKP